MFESLVNWITGIFAKRKEIKLGIYGSPNTGKTTLANKISTDWLGETVGITSEIPHETREVQKKEKIQLENNGKKLMINLLDMPGISTKVDYRDFLNYGMNVKKAQKRAKEATRGIIEAIKWLDNVDAALIVMDACEDPYTQVNLTIIGNLEARSIPVILIANKIDLPEAKPHKIKEAFPNYPLVEISALKGDNVDKLYETVLKKLG